MTCRTTTAQPKRYMTGNAVTVTVILYDTDGEVVDPANLRMLTLAPSEVTSESVAMTVDGDRAIGVFVPDTAGVWRYRVETFTGAVNAAVERTLTVVARDVPATM